MMKLENYFQYADEIGSKEIRVLSGYKPEFRKNSKWVSSHFEKLNVNQAKEIIFSNLNDNAQSEFVNKGTISGTLQFKAKPVNYVISHSVSGICGYFTWACENIKLDDFHLPKSFMEIFKKISGVSIITGPRSSGKSTLLKTLANRIKEEEMSIAIFSDSAEFYRIVESKEIQIYETKKNITCLNEISRGYDFILIDSMDARVWEQGIKLGSYGLKVILILPYATTELAISHLAGELDLVDGLGLETVSNVVQMILGLRLVEGLQRANEIAYEMIYMTKKIRSFIRSGDWDKIKEMAMEVSDENGVQTLNQSLLNLMIKRKIDLKTGYASSPYPEELDRMFEKIGL